MLSSPRTGSTLLVRSLDSSPSILCAGEIFHTGRAIHHPEFRYEHEWLGSVGLGRLRDVFFGRFRIREHLHSLYSSTETRVEAVGFKLMLIQLRRFSAIMPALTEMGVKFLYLYRNDPVATALSYCRAKATGVFHSDRMRKDQKQRPLVISEYEFARVLRMCTLDKQELLSLCERFGGLLLRYEEMISEWDAFVDRIGAELGIEGLQVTQSLAKLQPGVDSVAIANEAALLAKFGDPALPAAR